MAKRVGSIVTKVLKKLKQMGQSEVTADDLIAEMEHIQLELARRFLAYKVSGDINITSGVYGYPLSSNIFKIREFYPPSDWKLPFVITHDSSEWARVRNMELRDDSQPQAGFIWDSLLSVAPTPSADATLSYIGYGLPTDGQLTYDGDPVIGSEWDNCIENELIYRFGDDKDAHILYEQRAAQLAQENFKGSVAGVIRVAHSSDSLGF